MRFVAALSLTLLLAASPTVAATQWYLFKRSGSVGCERVDILLRLHQQIDAASRDRLMKEGECRTWPPIEPILVESFHAETVAGRKVRIGEAVFETVPFVHVRVLADDLVAARWYHF